MRGPEEPGLLFTLLTWGNASILIEPALSFDRPPPDGDELARPSRCENRVLANATRLIWRLLTRARKLSRVRPTRPGYKKTSLLREVLCTRGQKQVIMVVRPNG